MQNTEDFSLVKDVKSGDKASFDVLYNKYKRKIMNYLFRMTNNREMAEELAQETFVKAYLNIDKYKPTGSFSSWLYAIARNLAKNEFRKLSYRKNISLELTINESEDLRLMDVIKSKAYDAEELLNNNETNIRIEEILNSMPAEFKEVMILCIIQGISYDEAAGIIGCSKATVAIRLFRARKYFIDLMKKADN